MALAAIAPERITKAVLVSCHVMPYDHPEIVAGLSEAEQADVHGLRGGRTPELEAEYAAMAAEVASDPMRLLSELAEGWGRREQSLEFELPEVRCPVRAIHRTIDDLEPYANLERAASQLADCVVVALPGMGHFGPWLWPDAIFGLLAGH